MRLACPSWPALRRQDQDAAARRWPPAISSPICICATTAIRRPPGWRPVFAARRAADALYVPGGLFEVWVGDDGAMPAHAATLDAFAALHAERVRAYFMRGHRDFAVGGGFCCRTGMRMLDAPTVLSP